MISPHRDDRITDRASWRDFKEADLEAYGLSRWWPHYRLVHPGLYYQRVMRDTEYLYASGRHTLAKLRRAYLKMLGILSGISVPPGVFGRGLTIPHVGSIVVNDKVRAGSFCRLHSATNIGEYSGSAPILGNGVYVGPGAVLYGPIRLGSRSVVGANSVVNSDVPANTVVAGAPAKVVSISAPNDSMPIHILCALDKLDGLGGDASDARDSRDA